MESEIQNPKSKIATPWKLVIAAGGTGGHISPALAIADHLTRTQPSCAVEFVCGSRPVEIEIYRKAGITPRAMDIERLVPGWRGLLANVFNLRRAMKTARLYVSEARPQVVLGMGGYVCVPVVSAAAGAKIPAMIHEQNAVAGRANRWLSRRVQAIACAYPEAATSFPAAKTRVTGNPVRPGFVGGDRAAALGKWNLAASLPTLLVFGGSQGARRLNQVVLDSLKPLDAAVSNVGGLQILWSCGELNFEELKKQTDAASLKAVSVRLVPFIRDMGLAYAVADLALCRAGAMALAELTANAIPAILVPLPSAAANHQWHNAKPLGDAGAALVLEEKDVTGSGLATTVAGLLSDRAELARMKEISRRLGRPRAVEEIAEMILGLRGESA